MAAVLPRRLLRAAPPHSPDRDSARDAAECDRRLIGSQPTDLARAAAVPGMWCALGRGGQGAPCLGPGIVKAAEDAAALRARRIYSAAALCADSTLSASRPVSSAKW